ncbi:unnamed protein product [Paramecium sonneborni]|uniref:Uncharacterized protein n=1 Tax=Paramecium sonneborni TaxID=65129 RepID=A0A8S1NSD8_9CILI|nr:unnamed protein product [Paramecium sonneborni]
MILYEQISDEDQFIDCFSQGKVLCLYQERLFSSKLIINEVYRLLLQITPLEDNQNKIRKIISQFYTILMSNTFQRRNFQCRLYRNYSKFKLFTQQYYFKCLEEVIFN